MPSSTLCLPNYSVGEDCYSLIPHFTRRFGNKAVVIGGKTAMEKARPELEKALQDSEVTITDYIWYGGNSTYENGDRLKAMPEVQEADLIFGVGGGRAIDTAKYVANELDKPLFNFPTLGSNCAAVTAIAVFYNEDGSFRDYYYPQLAEHTFIHTGIIADSPEHLLWAGIGDALSKEVEAVFSSKDHELTHTPSMGIALSKICTKPLLKYGKQALQECHDKVPGKALEEVVLDIIVSTGLVSNMVSNVPEYYYNSSLAHMVYYGATACENGHKHLHGEVVSLGVLCLLEHMQEEELLDEILHFNSDLGLPVCFDDIEIGEDEFDTMADVMVTTTEWKYRDPSITRDDLLEMMTSINEKGQAFKSQPVLTA